MELKIYEYNVTPKIEERNEFSIRLVNGTLTINGRETTEESIINAIKKILLDNKENIIKLASERQENYKGGRQKGFAVKFEVDGEIYRIIGNTPSQEIADFYFKIKSEITNAIEG